MNPAINSIGSYICTHLDKIGLLYQAAETGSVVWQTSSAERFEQNAKVRNVFTAASMFMTYVSALALFQGQWGLVSKVIRIVPGVILPMLSIPAIIGICMAVLFVGYGIAQTMKKNDAPERIDMLQTANAARIVVNLALAYFAANPYLFLATVGMELVSLGVVREWKWIKHTTELTTTLQHATKIKVSYFLPVFPVQVCTNHPMHEKKAQTHVMQQFHKTKDHFDFTGLRVDTEKSKKKANNQFESISYRMYLNAVDLPKCADDHCAKPLSGHVDTEVSVYDTRFPEEDRWKKAEVVITPSGQGHQLMGAFEAAAT